MESYQVFVGDIPLPTLDSKSLRAHVAGALYDFVTPKNAICLRDVGYLLQKWHCNH